MTDPVQYVLDESRIPTRWRNDCFAGRLEDRDYDERGLAMALAGLPPVKEAA